MVDEPQKDNDQGKNPSEEKLSKDSESQKLRKQISKI